VVKLVTYAWYKEEKEEEGRKKRNGIGINGRRGIKDKGCKAIREV
jgi:hypothetical protein